VEAMKAVIDSDVLIDFLQSLDAAAAEIDRYEDPCYSDFDPNDPRIRLPYRS
jgi:hypothetical protein